MIRIIATVAASFLALALTGCGDDSKKETTAPTSQSTSTTATAPADTNAPATNTAAPADAQKPADAEQH